MLFDSISLVQPYGALYLGLAAALVAAFVISKWLVGSNARNVTFLRAGLRAIPLLIYGAGVAGECRLAWVSGSAAAMEAVNELLAVTRVMPGLIIVATVGLLTETLVGRIEKWRLQAT